MVASLRAIYTILWYFLLPRVFLRLVVRSRSNPAYLKGWRDRLGFVQMREPEAGPPRRIWIHAVSVGEVRAAVPLIQALHRRDPVLDILVTTTTPTGAATVRELLGDTVQHRYFPFDLPTGIGRFLNRVRPSLVIIMETELWPNLLRALRKRAIPCVLANARLSERAYRRYGVLRKAMASVLADLTLIAAQTHEDAERFIALGADRARVAVVGNFKFDSGLPVDALARRDEVAATLGRSRAVWVAASTHETEEALMLDVQRRLQSQGFAPMLVLVPRHPERFERVYELCRQRGMSVVRRTESRACAESTDVFLVDTMGELLSFFSVADVAVVCGSFTAVGGHNPLEPASLSVPVLTGPQFFNFKAVYDRLIDRGGAAVVDDAAQLTNELGTLFKNPEVRKQRGVQAFRAAQEDRGAVGRLLALLTDQLQVVVQ